MKIFRKKSVPHHSSGKHVIAVHNDCVHAIEENGDEIIIAGVKYTRKEAVAHLRNIAAGIQHIAKNIEKGTS
jgi:hypothetical protein